MAIRELNLEEMKLVSGGYDEYNGDFDGPPEDDPPSPGDIPPSDGPCIIPGNPGES